MTTGTDGHISHSIREVLEGIGAENLTAIAASMRAREVSGPPPALEWEQRPRTIEDKTYTFAQWARSIGAGEDLIGCDLMTKLLRLGHSEVDAAEILKDAGVVWRARSADDRLVEVAAGMLADGWDESTVRQAVAGLVTDGH